MFHALRNGYTDYHFHMERHTSETNEQIEAALESFQTLKLMASQSYSFIRMEHAHEALHFAEGRAELYRSLAKEEPSFEPKLALSLSDLAGELSRADSGRKVEALAVL